MADLKSLEAFPPKRKATDKTWHDQAQEFVKSLDTLSSVTWTKPVNKQNILDVLNLPTQTIPYTFALRAQLAAIGKNGAGAEGCLEYAAVFFVSFDPVQIRYVDDHWRYIIESCFEIYHHLKIREFSQITAAMLRLDPTGGTFTTNHLRLVRHCLGAGCPSQALPILDKDIYAFPQTPLKHAQEELLNEEHELSNGYITAGSGFAGKPRTEHILEYYLLGAHTYTGLRRYGRARLFLEYTILTPSINHACSALQVEAYRQWILLGLLADGQRFPIPRTIDQQVLKTLRATSKAYEALADDFEKRDHRKFQAEMEVGMEVWENDGTLRFVTEASQALFRFRVADLQKTYASLHVSRVASLLHMQPGAAQQILTDMIRAGQLSASITPSTSDDAILRFHSGTTSSSSSTRDGDTLEAQTKRIENLVTSIKDADSRLRLTSEYVTHAQRAKKSAMGPDGELAEQMDLSWDAPIANLGDEDDGDEDIMGA